MAYARLEGNEWREGAEQPGFHSPPPPPSNPESRNSENFSAGLQRDYGVAAWRRTKRRSSPVYQEHVRLGV